MPDDAAAANSEDKQESAQPSDATRAATRAAASNPEQPRAPGSNAAKSRFVANISHELRTPLNAVIGYSDRFREDPASYDAESLAQGFERIHDSGRQLLNLINDVLDLTKAQSGRLRVSLEDDREKAFAAGCDDYHAKPVHFTKLLEQIEALLSSTF